jgi:hypothetical protein
MVCLDLDAAVLALHHHTPRPPMQAPAGQEIIRQTPMPSTKRPRANARLAAF